MTPGTRIALGVFGFVLLIVAGLRVVGDVASSVHSEGPILQADGGGYQIDRIIHIDFWTLLLGLLGLVALVASIALRSRRVQNGQI